jgi:hypothetical protein
MGCSPGIQTADEIKDDEMKQLFAMQDGSGQLNRDEIIAATGESDKSWPKRSARLLACHSHHSN